jgi:hypothetical protein
MSGDRIGAVLIALSVVGLAGSCSDGGKKSSSPPLSPTGNAGSVAAAIRLAIRGATLATAGNTVNPTPGKAFPVDPREAVTESPCDVDGTTSTTTMADGTRTVGYTDCTSMASGEKTVRNGAVSVTPNNSGLVVDVNDYRIERSKPSATDPSAWVLLERSAMSYYMLWTGDAGTGRQGCGNASIPTNARIQTHGVFTHREDLNADGTLERDEETRTDELFLDISIVTLDTTTCTPTAFTADAFGSVVLTDGLDPARSVTIAMATEDPLHILVERAPSGTGMGYKLHGPCRITVPSCGTTGSVDLVTIEEIVVPDGGSCPTAGKVQVTGELTQTITFAADGSVLVDMDSNGTVDFTFTDCGQVTACVP